MGEDGIADRSGCTGQHSARRVSAEQGPCCLGHPRAEGATQWIGKPQDMRKTGELTTLRPPRLRREVPFEIEGAAAWRSGAEGSSRGPHRTPLLLSHAPLLVPAAARSRRGRAAVQRQQAGLAAAAAPWRSPEPGRRGVLGRPSAAPVAPSKWLPSSHP
jgi:hypothetical protein